MGDKIVKGKGKTALEALQSLPRPVKIFNKGIVTFTNGENSRTQVLMPIALKRLWYKVTQPMLAKRFELGVMGLK